MKSIDCITNNTYPQEFQILTDLATNLRINDKLTKSGIDIAIIISIDEDKIGIRWEYPEDIKNKKSYYYFTPSVSNSGEDCLLLKNEKEDLQLNESILEFQDKKVYRLSKEDIQSLVRQAVIKVIKSKGLMSWDRCLKKINVTNRASSGDLFPKK